ncbi:MAG TPA: hypothetical protein PKY82_00345 [Pyrinomonadaceae bacterium]|nr:hypothetical protein [Pyrinomonadaceae bacterium]
MFKKITILTLLVSIFSIASSANIFAQTKMSDENQPVSINPEPRRETFLKKEVQPNFEQKETMADYKKQKAQGSKFSTGTKVLIGVGIAAAVLGVVIFAASRDKIEPFKNGVL